MLEALLSILTTYGPAALGLVMLVGAAGLPLPTAPLLIAAGAFIRDGTLAWPAAAGLALAGVVLGDLTSYGLGRWAQDWVGRQASRLGDTYYKAQARFEKYGGWAVLLTRFLMNSLDVPVNLVAGSNGYSARRFLTCVVPGRVIWLLVYLGLGYAFGSQWPIVSQTLGAYAGYLAAAAVVLVGAYALARRLWGRGACTQAAKA